MAMSSPLKHHTQACRYSLQRYLDQQSAKFVLVKISGLRNRWQQICCLQQFDRIMGERSHLTQSAAQNKGAAWIFCSFRSLGQPTIQAHELPEHKNSCRLT